MTCLGDQMNSSSVLALFLISIVDGAAGDEALRWPQFRGPNADGVAVEGQRVPVEFGPNQNLLWRTPLPSGFSSPCIWGNRIFLTAFDHDTQKLESICIDR